MTVKSLSLIEQKKLQWNKEREEMTKFYGLWAPTTFQINRRKISDSCITHINKLHEVYELDESSLSRCLPPIQKNGYYESNRNNDTRNNSECNTSGYGSETDSKEQFTFDKKKQWKSQSNLLLDTSRTNSTNDNIDDNAVRMKWGDRGVGVGHLWEPTLNCEARLPEINNRPGTPHWLQRSLLNKSHIRGQNLPTEPETILIREQKRLKALELQEAIKQQLQEREQRRKEDKELQLEEERKLEQRMKRQHEVEKNRIEEELKKQREKEEKETKKTKAMQEAIANAEQLAKEAKIKTRNKSTDSKIADENNNKNEIKELLFDYEVDNFVEKTSQEKSPSIISQKKTVLIDKSDASTSLTLKNYYEEFQIVIPLITNKWTQTNTCMIPKTKKKMSKNNNDRPKWGVNRPNTKYMKQSEKDVFYQRKVKHRYRRDRFDQEPSGSSRSLDSTDDSKSLSTSPNEKNFGQTNSRLDLNFRKTLTPYAIERDGSSENIPFEEKTVVNNFGDSKNEESFDSKEKLLNQLDILSHNLTNKQAYWKEEMKKFPSEFSLISQDTR